MQLAKEKQQVGPSSRCDLSKYLDTGYCSYLSLNEVKNIDIMKWWKSHEFTFPVLSKMACDLLTLPVFTSIGICFFYSCKYNRSQEDNSYSIDAKSQCFHNWIDHRTRKVTGSRFTGQTDGRTGDVINIYFYILLIFLKN